MMWHAIAEYIVDVVLLDLHLQLRMFGEKPE